MTSAEPHVAYVALEKRLKRFTRADMTVYFGDLMDHINKVCETLDETRDVIDLFKDTDSTLATYRVNDILRVLTILATIGTVLTVLASFYGMNIPLPGGSNPGGSPHTWWILLVVMFVIMGAMLVYFRRKRFL